VSGTSHGQGDAHRHPLSGAPHGHGDPIAWDPGPPRSRKGLGLVVAGVLMITAGAWMWSEGRARDVPSAWTDEDVERRLAEIARLSPERAETELRELTDDRPDDPRVLVDLAGAQARLGERDEAYGTAKRVEALAPDDARFAALLAALYDELGRSDDAIAAAARASELSPDRWEPLASLALLRARAGDVDGARVDLLRARSLAPDEPLLESVAADIEAAARR
jgi:Flp pilus assembly protein TadD